MTSPHSAWFAVNSKTNRERRVATALRNQGYEVFLPTYKVRRRWSDRIKEFLAPLFPSYVFCRFDPGDKLPLLKTPGVLSIVCVGSRPVSVDEEELENVRAMVGSGLPAYPWPYLKSGQSVTIAEGPLRGLRATLVETQTSGRKLIVSITMLNRSIAVDIDPAWIMR